MPLNGSFRILQVGAVVHECSDLDLLSELRDSANVVAMIMSDEDVIDLLQARRPRRSQDAPGIPAAKTRPASINQQGLAARINDQRCLSALHINEIDFERLRCFCQSCGCDK